MNRLRAAVIATIFMLGCIPGDDYTQNPPVLEITDYVSGLDRPWDVTWAPAGQMLFTENNTGDIWVESGGSAASIHTISDLDSSGEGGLMGITLSPTFGTDHLVFVCYTSTAPDVRIVRFEIDAGISSLSNKTPIVTGGPYSTGRHSGCRIKFGPDGYLWATFGDAAIGTNPQDDNSLGGKILRVDLDGNAAPDNPSGKIWFAKGYRNPQGIDFRPSDGLACIAQHGPYTDDEIECLGSSCLLNSCNSGWNPVPGYNEAVSMTDLTAYPTANEALWSSGAPTLAPAGMSFLDGGQWGIWDEAIVVAFLKARRLGFYQLGQAQGLQYSAYTNFSNRLRTAEQGPDGCLYILEDVISSGKILRACAAP